MEQMYEREPSCHADRIKSGYAPCNRVPNASEGSRASSRSYLLLAVLRRAPELSYPLIQAMEKLKTTELAALRETLTPLVSNLDETVKGLPETEQNSYDEAEQSVVDARRKAETHEGLLQVN